MSEKPALMKTLSSELAEAEHDTVFFEKLTLGGMIVAVGPASNR